RGTGLRHAGFNLLATGLFVITAAVLYVSWTHRVLIDGEYVFDATIPLALAVVAWVSMVIAGSLGWTLVQTHHIGVKPALTRADRPSREPELDDIDDVVDLPPLRKAPRRPDPPSIRPC